MENQELFTQRAFMVTVKCYSVGVLVQQKIDKMMCEIAQVSANDSKRRYLWETMPLSKVYEVTRTIFQGQYVRFTKQKCQELIS